MSTSFSLFWALHEWDLCCFFSNLAFNWLSGAFCFGERERQMQVILRFQSLHTREMDFSELWQPTNTLLLRLQRLPINYDNVFVLTQSCKCWWVPLQEIWSFCIQKAECYHKVNQLTLRSDWYLDIYPCEKISQEVINIGLMKRDSLVPALCVSHPLCAKWFYMGRRWFSRWKGKVGYRSWWGPIILPDIAPNSCLQRLR